MGRGLDKLSSNEGEMKLSEVDLPDAIYVCGKVVLKSCGRVVTVARNGRFFAEIFVIKVMDK